MFIRRATTRVAPTVFESDWLFLDLVFVTGNDRRGYTGTIDHIVTEDGIKMHDQVDRENPSHKMMCPMQSVAASHERYHPPEPDRVESAGIVFAVHGKPGKNHEARAAKNEQEVG